MATVTARSNVWNTTTGVKTTASFTPTAGELLVAIVGTAGTDTAPTITDTDTSITGWTLVDSFRSHGSAVTGGLRIYVSDQGASGSAITVTQTPGAADTGGGIGVLSVTDPAAYGASAVRSTGGQADQAAGTPAPVLSNTPLTKNPCLIAVMTNTNGSANASPRTATTPDYSEAYDVGFNTPPSGIEIQYINGAETSATLTTGGATPSGFAAIGVEFNTVAVFTRSAAIDITPSVTSARIVESLRSASVTATPVVTAAGTVEHVHSRSASVTITADIASDGEVEGGAFDPTSVAGLYQWYDADALGLADNDPVTSWTDESGGGRHATSATGPTYKTGIQNGKPGILFDGTDDRLAVTVSADTSRTFFIVAKVTSVSAGRTAWSFAQADARLLSVATTGAWTWGQDSANATVALGGDARNTSVVTMVLTSASSMSGYVDSGSATTFDPDNLVTTLTGFNVGSTLTAAYWQGYVFEVLVYDSALGTTDREAVRDYLLDKWISAGPTVHESSASITLTPAITSARQTDHLRSASVTLTPAVSSVATFFSILARSAAVAITPAIATAPQRVLMRATAVTLTPAITAAGQIEGGLVVHERSASITLTPAVASSATFYSIIERSASVTIAPAIASAQMRVVMRQASVTLTPAVASSGAILQIWSRSASVTLTPSVSAAGFAGELFETHLPLTVEVRDALLTVIHDEGDTSIIFDNSESTVIYDETITDVAIEGDREAAVPEHLTSVDVAEPVLTVDYDEIPRTVEVA